jgi:hypothetical protein
VEEIVALLIQVVVEVGLQLLGGIGVDFLTAARSRDDRDRDGCGWLVLFAAIGAVCGGLSLLVVPNLFLPNLGLRIANLIVAPVLAGALSYLVARRLWTSRKGEPAHHFWRGFSFALAFGLVRFAYAHG